MKYLRLLEVEQSEIRSHYKGVLGRLESQESNSLEPILISANKVANGIDMKSGGSNTGIAILICAYEAITEKLDSLNSLSFASSLHGEFTIKVSFAEEETGQPIVEISSIGFSIKEIYQIVSIAKKRAFDSSNYRFS